MTKPNTKTTAPKLLETVFRESVAAGRCTEIEYTILVPGARKPDGKTAVFCNPGASLWGEVIAAGPAPKRKDWPEPRPPSYAVVLLDSAFKTGEVVGWHGCRKTAAGHAETFPDRPYYRPRVIPRGEFDRMTARGYRFTV